MSFTILTIKLTLLQELSPLLANSTVPCTEQDKKATCFFCFPPRLLMSDIGMLGDLPTHL